ncbi:MAG: CBS domain-containing protein [Lewinellaceae bacterium]|nr:CBS domain-containing protein [Saprospiraceae bacterium]MCB9316541.1 CBS domain-containing protein [Lewinellaceae bacterium]MCB9330471.1 CBS domain-containing protein [Lewinellaceae bacterium]
MNAYAPISTIMETDLVTVNPEETLLAVKKIFEQHSFHHLPVVRFKKIVGIISKTDFQHFTGGLNHASEQEVSNLLADKKAEDIMTKGLGKLEPDDRINVALEIFSKNWFHALPVVKNDELIGIVTTQDVIKAIINEKPKEPHMVYENLD